MTTAHVGDLLDSVLQAESPFALIHRFDGHRRSIDVLAGDVTQPASLAELPLRQASTQAARSGHDSHEMLVLIPYRQIRERGFACSDDAAPLIALSVSAQQTLSVADLLARIPDVPTELTGAHFDPDDDEYASITRRIIADEIGTGEGSNFVIKRSFLANISEYSTRKALAVFRRLLEQELGAYWTFIVHTPERTLLGATPERHLTLRTNTAVMNPISGTHRYPASGPTLEGLREFLADRKESDELFMVLDEELKMMARLCDSGVRVTGPYLRAMAKLAHTEYFIAGHTQRDVRELLRETMFAPTVTGSPVESAARVISRYEPKGRAYYSGVAALIGRDAVGERTLDSAILIRTAEIDAAGAVRIGVGSTLVRHSDPLSEVAETRAKVAGLLAALEPPERTRLFDHPLVLEALRHRNDGIADFWLRPQNGSSHVAPELAGLSVLIIDAQDNFTAMIGHQLRALGLIEEIRRIEDAVEFDHYDLVVMGPGPGDPCSTDDPRIVRLRAGVDMLLKKQRPFVAVCLSHQILSAHLGLELKRRSSPNQGAQGEIDLFGRNERVGFYNTFVAYSTKDKLAVNGVGIVEVSRDAGTGEVYALRGPAFTSMQFHPESVLTVDGPRILAQALKSALAA